VRRSTRVKLACAALLLIAQPLAAQGEPSESKPVRIFIDCHTQGCDLDFFRTEIPYVDYVRDRADASLHVLISSQPTGSGGSELTLTFIGLREFASIRDTLVYVSPQSATEDDRRKGIAQTLKLGLVRYIARTPLGERIHVTYAAPATTKADAASTKKRDPWNYWVFQTRANGSFSGESSQNFTSIYGSVSGNRITKDWKVNNSINVDYSESKFTLSDDEEFSSYSHSWSANQLIVKSLGPNWSVGERASLSSSTFLNMKRAWRFAPVIEYDVFPYSQSTRKLLTIQYSAGIASFQYHDTTIYEKISEVKPNQNLSVSLSATQPWGSISGTIEGSTYLDDFSKRRLVVFNSVNAKLFKGFSFNMFGSVSVLRDQIYLSKAGATEEEILLQRRQLSTSYSYFAGIGLSYTFGSIFNNVVNPRFEGANGISF
jgi:hypothetical protein